jgi:hypothetical protein
MENIGILLNSLCHIGYIAYVLGSIAEIKRMLKDIQKKM